MYFTQHHMGLSANTMPWRCLFMQYRRAGHLHSPLHQLGVH